MRNEEYFAYSTLCASPHFTVFYGSNGRFTAFTLIIGYLKSLLFMFVNLYKFISLPADVSKKAAERVTHRVDPDKTFCGVWSGSTLSVPILKVKRDIHNGWCHMSAESKHFLPAALETCVMFPYRNYIKCSDRQTWVNSADPDQTSKSCLCECVYLLRNSH